MTKLGEWGMSTTVYGIPLGSDEYILKLDSDDDCTIL